MFFAVLLAWRKKKMGTSLYKDVAEIYLRYWRAYGGMRALITSPYFHLSVVLIALTFGTWSQPQWWEQVISVLPNVLGFTLGGFAIFLGFGDEKFRAILAEKDPEDGPDEPSLYVALCATFLHFIVLQVIALLYAIVAKGLWFVVPWPEPVRAMLPIANMVGGAVGYFLFIYALTSALAAAVYIFRVSTWFETHSNSKGDSG